MREIKFRAITREGKIIKNVGKIEFFEDGSIIVNDEIPVEKLIQYTGIKDKNGKEIYEGDIIEIDDDWKSGEGERGEVDWDEKNATFRLFCYTKYGGEGWFMPENKTWMKLKIIGNIYENHELIEKDQALIQRGRKE